MCCAASVLRTSRPSSTTPLLITHVPTCAQGDGGAQQQQREQGQEQPKLYAGGRELSRASAALGKGLDTERNRRRRLLQQNGGLEVLRKTLRARVLCGRLQTQVP